MNTPFLQSLIPRISILFLITLLAISTLALSPVKRVSAACPTLPTPNGSVTQTFDIVREGDYKVWSRMMVPDGNLNSYYIEIDNTTCGVVVGDGAIPSKVWTWVDYRDGNINTKIKVHLTAGNHTIRMIGKETGVKLDRIILRSDACIPADKGDNCASGTVDPADPVSGTPSKGLLATYFKDQALTQIHKTQVDPAINFAWGEAAPVSGAPTDHFSVRWQGNVFPTATGDYTFYMAGDDGVRLWLNDKLIADGWKDQSATEYTSPRIRLTANRPYKLKAEYYDNAYDATAKLSWSGPSIAKQIIPASVLNTHAIGLKTSYFALTSSNDFGKTLLITTKPNINADWGTGSPGTGLPIDRFGVRWEGLLTAPRDGTYTFITESDDGARLTVNGKAIIDDWKVHAKTKRSATIALKANQAVSFRLSYFENYKAASVRLSWKGPQIAESVVPTGVFRQR